MVSEGKIDIPQMSQDILRTVNESEAMDHNGNGRDATTHLLTLEHYAPLSKISSFDVQMLCSSLYAKLSDSGDVDGCKQRASAMMEILHKDSGTGAQPGDPVHLIMTSDMIEWVRSQPAKATGVQPYAYDGKELQQVTYIGPTTGGQPAAVYFALDPRVAAQAREKRAQFLADKSFNYPSLLQLAKTSLRQAQQLEQQGDYAGALTQLKSIERLHPIEDTPLVDLIGTYSALLGKTGDSHAQSKMGLCLFGILQDMAHNGDGLSP